MDLNTQVSEVAPLVNWMNSASGKIEALDAKLREIPPLLDAFQRPDQDMRDFLTESGLGEAGSEALGALLELGGIVRQARPARLPAHAQLRMSDFCSSGNWPTVRF